MRQGRRSAARPRRARGRPDGPSWPAREPMNPPHPKTPPPVKRQAKAHSPSPAPLLNRRSRCGRWLREGWRSVSAQLLDADEIAGGVAEGAVADPVRLLGRLLDDLGAAGLHPLEGAVEVLGGHEDAGVGAL